MGDWGGIISTHLRGSSGTSSIERQVCACPRPFKAQPPDEAKVGHSALENISSCVKRIKYLKTDSMKLYTQKKQILL